jgi:heme-degrading monooxygenase HmoA
MDRFAPGQIVTVFRNRLDPDGVEAYTSRIEEIRRLAAAMPGLVEFKTFTADDGERATLVTFADEASQRAWREHTEHRAAQQEGRTTYYAEYSIQVCETLRAREFRKP